MSRRLGSVCAHMAQLLDELAGKQGVSTSVSVLTAFLRSGSQSQAYHWCVAEPRFFFSSSRSLLSDTAKRLAFPVATQSPEDGGPPKEMCVALRSSGTEEGFPGHDFIDLHNSGCAA